MTDATTNSVFQSALRAYRSGRMREASLKFRALIEQGSTAPQHLSYCGLLTALYERRLREGREMCERAYLLAAAADPQVSHNLALLHARTGRRSRALEVLRLALSAHPGHPGLMREIQRLSPRRAPVLGGLHRDHLFNRALGRLRARLSDGPRQQR